MPIKSNPTDAVARWRAGVGAAGQRYTSGVQNSTDWAAAATSPAAVNARNSGLQRAIANGTIDQGIQKIGTAGWRNATVAKAANWQNGVNSQVAQANATSGFQRLFSYLQQAENAISSLPRGGFAENMQRSQAYLTSVHDQAQAAKGY